jgi:hypothetical protein
MPHRLVIGATLTCLLVGAGHRFPGAIGAAAAQTEHTGCSQLAMLRLPDVRISEAIAVPVATTGAVRAAHCRVDGVIGTEIRFSLLLPDVWNKRFFMGGGGGFVGSIQNSALTTVNQGFATVGTDTGHQGGGTDASWALNNLERRLNFGYLAVHRTAEVAKAIIRSYYGNEAARSYFTGCSRGGGQALMEAQRYPGDFDGIVAGAPAYNWTALAAQAVRQAQAAYPDPQALTPLFTPQELKAVELQILEACDTLDGVKDGVMEDPRRCSFNVDALSLSATKRAVLKALYAPTTTRDGEIYPGQPFGGEGQTAGWPAWITGSTAPAGAPAPSLRFAFGTGIYKYFIANDPAWDYSHYDLNNWKKDSALSATFLNATNPDLDAFKSKGGKLILWHGWADPALTALGSIRYFDEVKARDAGAGDYFRMFLMPGVLHCGGGTGPDTADWNTALVNWVEQGSAPERIVARQSDGNATARTRPLCAYPKRAEYTGSGSIEDEANFVCR